MASGSSPGAVSYTHLDVYKRQVQDRGLRLHAAGGKLRLHSRDAKMTLTAEKAVTFASASAAVLVPVSYTHLDVYKRQA